MFGLNRPTRVNTLRRYAPNGMVSTTNGLPSVAVRNPELPMPNGDDIAAATASPTSPVPTDCSAPLAASAPVSSIVVTHSRR